MNTALNKSDGDLPCQIQIKKIKFIGFTTLPPSSIKKISQKSDIFTGKLILHTACSFRKVLYKANTE